MRIEIRNLKTFPGMEGQGFSAAIYVDGHRAGEVTDDARGGEFHYRVPDADLRTILAYAAEHGKELPPDLKHGLSPDAASRVQLDSLVNDLVTRALEDKTIKRWCSTKTVFRLKGDKPGEYRTIKANYSLKVAEHLREKHGESLEEILNERYTRSRAP